MRRASLIGAALATALLVGCGRSPRTEFFTLGALRADRAAGVFAGRPVQVRAVHIPGVLDRPERVLRRSGQRLDIQEDQQWGAPLADMIRRVLTEDLVSRLPAGMVFAQSAPADADTRGLVIDIQEFQADSKGQVVLDASWVLLGGQPAHPLTRGRQHFEQAGGPVADSQVAAMSALLGRMADAIAAVLKSQAS